MEDWSKFLELFKLNQHQDKNNDLDNYISRIIKLDKEMKRMKKNLHADLANEELRKILPLESFLRLIIENP